MVVITDEDKQEIGMYFDEGIHKVKIAGVILESDNPDKEYFDVGIVGDNGENTSVRMYATEKALKFTVNTLRAIFVHNTPEDKKQAVRDAVNACKTTEELAKLCEKLEGKECWYSKFKTGTQYTNSQGELKDSYSNNLFGYEPKPPKHVVIAQQTAAMMGGEVTTDNLDEFPFK